MNDDFDRLLRSYAKEITALPADDPLRKELARSGVAGNGEQAELDAVAAALRAELADVAVPPIEPALLAVPHSRRRARLIAVLAVAAGLVLAFVLGQRLGHAPETVVDAPSTAVVDAASEPAATRDGPRVIAVKFWHITCPACRELDPRYAKVIESIDESEVLFVTLDMSTELSRRQSALLASALGIRDVYDEVFGSSGFVLLFDATTKRRLGQLSAKQGGDEMETSIRDALSRSRS